MLEYAASTPDSYVVNNIRKRLALNAIPSLFPLANIDLPSPKRRKIGHSMCFVPILK